jgi:hypothetical protein
MARNWTVKIFFYGLKHVLAGDMLCLKFPIVSFLSLKPYHFLLFPPIFFSCFFLLVNGHLFLFSFGPIRLVCLNWTFFFKILLHYQRLVWLFKFFLGCVCQTSLYGLKNCIFLWQNLCQAKHGLKAIHRLSPTTRAGLYSWNQNQHMPKNLC